MAIERGIALAAFALGVAIVVLALTGCGEDDERPTSCTNGNHAVPVVGARLVGDSTVRLVYAGAEPCSFAADRHEGRLYVELRSVVPLDRSEPVSGCVEGALDFRVPPGTPVERVYGNGRLVDEEEIERLLSDQAECRAVPELLPAFIID